MSLQAIVWVFKHSEARLGNRLVLLALADYAHDDGTEARPSVETLAMKARLSERQVKRALGELVRSGEIVKTGRTKLGVNVYSVKMDGDNLSPPGVTNPTEKVPDLSPDPTKELEGVSDETPARLIGKRNGRDYLWDIFDRELGEPTNDSERGRRNAALKEIRQSLAAWLVGRPPERDDGPAAVAGELARRIRRFREMYPGATVTETAIASNWRTLAVVVPDDPFLCRNCHARFNSTLELREHREEKHGIAA